MFKKCCLFFLLISITSVFSNTSVASSPRWVRSSFTDNTATTMTITWNSDNEDGSKVDYGFNANYGNQVTGSSEQVDGELGYSHIVKLTGLTPNTTYHYRVSDSSGQSEDFIFTSGLSGQCDEFSFGVAGDNRGNLSGASLCWSTVYEAIAAQGVRFVINTGDLVNEGKNTDEWVDFLEKSEDWMQQIPIIPCLGNHDDDEVEGDGALYNKVFSLPRNNVTGTEDFYSFDYGNAHFSAISTHTFNSESYQTQKDWLIADLAATNKMWKIVFFHRPIYSGGNHGGNEDDHNHIFIPIFDEYHVDLVLTGHDHIYERYEPMKNNQVVSSYEEGTCYIVSGGGGALTDIIYNVRPGENGLKVGQNKYHYVKVTIHNNILHVYAENVSGSGCILGDEGVIDEFEIVKPLTNDPCGTAPSDNDNDGHYPPGDCEDNDTTIHPGADEICGDGIDQDCNGEDLTCPDSNNNSNNTNNSSNDVQDNDNDGFLPPDDCNDNDSEINPSALEICGDGIDQNCDNNDLKCENNNQEDTNNLVGDNSSNNTSSDTANTNNNSDSNNSNEGSNFQESNNNQESNSNADSQNNSSSAASASDSSCSCSSLK